MTPTGSNLRSLVVRLDCFLLPFFHPFQLPYNSPLPCVRPSFFCVFFQLYFIIQTQNIYLLNIKHTVANDYCTTTSIFILEAPPLLPPLFRRLYLLSRRSELLTKSLTLNIQLCYTTTSIFILKFTTETARN